jgi:hypothetical protein
MIKGLLEEKLASDKYDPQVSKQLAKTLTAVLHERVKGGCCCR